MRSAWFVVWIGLVGCNGGAGDSDGTATGTSTGGTTATGTSSWTFTGEWDDADGLSGSGLVNPFPNPWLMEDGKVKIPADQLPETPTPFPTFRLTHRSGFSPAQVITLRVPGFDCSNCPGWMEPTPGEGSVRLFDRTTLEFLPVMAELDAYPGANAPTTLIRPLQALADGHDIAVVVMTDAMDRPDRFSALVDGSVDSAFVGHYAELMADVESMGIAVNDVALAWDFPVGDGSVKLDSALDQVEIPTNWQFNFVKNADDGDSVPWYTWRTARGTITVQKFLDGGKLALNTDGTVNEVDTDTTPLVIVIPESVKDAPADSVPVIVYGHSLLSTARIEMYDFSGVIHQIANETGSIVVGTNWGGLDGDSLLVPVAVANDLGRLPELSGQMVQGQANTHALVRLVLEGGLMDDPVMLGSSGQRLANPDSVTFWGLSMGGILGGVLMAQDLPVEAGVLTVGGGGWSTLLERSNNWSQFEGLILGSMPQPEDRQLVYALGQLFWDEVDPMTYATQLQNQSILLQESIGDDAVSNLATRNLARSLGLPVLSPEIEVPYGLVSVAADLPPGSRALVQYDSERAMPADENRPASYTGAHTACYVWDEHVWQARDFLMPGMEGQVNHYCGAEPCTASTIQ